MQIKLSVAPKLTRTSHSAIACVDLNRTGIRIDLYLLLYTLIHSAFAQAARFRHQENPFCPQIICLQMHFALPQAHCGGLLGMPVLFVGLRVGPWS